MIALFPMSAQSAHQTQKGINTVLFSIFVCVVSHIAIATFNTVIAYRMFSEYPAALVGI